MERRLRAVERMDAVESATILALPGVGSERETAGEESNGDDEGNVDDGLPGAA